MRFKNPFSDLTKFELSLWIISITVIIVSFIVSGGDDNLPLHDSSHSSYGGGVMFEKSI